MKKGRMEGFYTDQKGRKKYRRKEKLKRCTSVCIDLPPRRACSCRERSGVSQESGASERENELLSNFITRQPSLKRP